MKFTVDRIRKKLWKKFNTGWRKVLMMMTSAHGNEGVGDFVSNEGCHIAKNKSTLIFLHWTSVCYNLGRVHVFNEIISLEHHNLV